MKFRTIILCLVGIWPGVMAEQLSENEQKTAHLAIIAVGARPDSSDPAVLKVKAPPQLLFIEQGEKNQIRYVVGLNGNPVFNEVPAGKPIKLERKVELHRSEKEHYIFTPVIPAGSKYILFLSPASLTSNGWRSKPVVDLLNIDSEGLQGKNMLVKNLTKSKVKINIENFSAFVAAEGELGVFLGVAERKYKNIEVFEYGGENKQLVKSAVKISPSHFHLVVLYEANPKTNRGKKMGFYKATLVKPTQIEAEAQSDGQE